MSDVAVQPASAEPSPATPALAVPSDPAEYATWRQTGKVPERKAAPAADKAQPKAEKAASPSSDNHAPDSETGVHQERKNNAATRLTELLDDLKRAGLTPAELKTFKREAQKQDQQQAQSQAAPEKTDKPAARERPKRPKMEDFNTIDEHETALDKYYEELSDFKAGQKIEAYQQNQRQLAQTASLTEQVQAASKRYGETAVPTIVETAKAFHGDQSIAPAVKDIIDQSPVAVDLLYVMGSKAEDLQALLTSARTDPGAAIRKIVLLERLVTEELAKGGASEKPAGAAVRGEDGKFVAAVEKPAPETKVSKAPTPPKEVSGRGTAPQDEVESAVKNNDFAAFRNAQNRRDFERRKGR